MTQNPLPSKNELLDYIRNQAEGMTKKQLSSAFNLAIDDRRGMRFLLKSLEKKGLILRKQGRFYKNEDANKKDTNKNAPQTIIMRVVTEQPLSGTIINPENHTDDTNEALSLPQEVQLLKNQELIPINDPKTHLRRLKKGDQILVKIHSHPSGEVKAQVITRLNKPQRSFMAIYRSGDDYDILEPIHKKIRDTYMVSHDHAHDAKDGDLVKAEPLKGNNQYSRKQGRQKVKKAKIIDIHTKLSSAFALNEIGLIEHDVPRDFTEKALQDAQKRGAVDHHERTDLRHIPFVTIDGEDAKDFDDAVFAEPDLQTKGWHIMVAIADVSWYVRPHTALDRAALERGNSTYLPGMVVPMLPEILSNEWCSLKPNVDRGALVCEIWLDNTGQMKKFKFTRALIQSAARLTYKQVHQYLDKPKSQNFSRAEIPTAIDNLHSVWLLLDNLRRQRGALALESSERKIIVGDDGKITDIYPAPHWLSHQIIEEFMILANVAAAKQLALSGFAQKELCMYRVHDQPNAEKLSALTPLLSSMGIYAKKLNKPRPKDINHILEQAKQKQVSQFVSKAILRCQSRAQYTPENIGHYGLSLEEYCHFTSPIRRYPDLLIHRALVSACALGDGGLELEPTPFTEIGDHCNMTERRATLCERDTLDRLTAQFLAPHKGEVFEAKVDGMNRSGMFIVLDDTGASGFCPMSKLPFGRFFYDEAQGALIEGRKAYRIGDSVIARLVEVAPASGSMVFQVETMPSHPISRSTSPSKEQKREKKSRKKRHYPKKHR